MLKGHGWLFPKLDFKLQGWLSSLSDSHEILSLGSTPRSILIFTRLLLSRKLVIYFRYLNTENKIVKENLLLIRDILIFSFRLIGLIELRWIHHNFDKETIEEFPLYVKLRKKFLSKYSSRIYVLSEKIKQVYPSNYKHKVVSISFGKPLKRYPKPTVIIEKIEEWRASFPRECKIGLSVAFSPKNVGLRNEIEKIRDIDGDRIRWIVFTNKPWADSSILFFETRVNFNENDLSPYIDFAYKSMSDISIPYSLYSATYANIPFCAYYSSFFSTLIDEYRIGCTIRENSSLYDLLNQSFDFDTFKSDHTWAVGAQELFRVNKSAG